ncbi:MAG: glycoside hydrolase family 3 C-terminal domain-containing protein [Clostridia bacterium]|nr:glycoside hydrolase family 3 C-terminal domain-containing protein [Clostridia bacterium]
MTGWIRSKYNPCLPLGENGARATGSEKHLALSRTIAAEGVVLLKNNGVLPLHRSNTVALFGIHQIEYIKGGSGSGNVTVEYVTNIYDGLKEKAAEGKISLYAAPSDYYIKILPDLLKGVRTEGLLLADPFVEEPVLPGEIVQKAAKNADVAICVIGRNSGEECDRAGNKGDFYLSDTEENMLSDIKKYFEKIVVVVNSGGIIDFAHFERDDKISAVIMGWQGGQQGGIAMADVLCADVCPSGRLTDTVAERFESYPFSDAFSDTNNFVKYYEDIYVGYRYFETFAKEKVVYPFGFGLSYTKFEISDLKGSDDGKTIKVSATVTNTGDMPGKEVLQVYYSAPQGKLHKPEYELASFAKTKLLSPGESEHLTVEFDINIMASYDDLGRCEKSAYILESGNYFVYAGTNVRNIVKIDYDFCVQEEYRVIEKLSPKCVPYRLEKRLSGEGWEMLPVSSKPEFEYKDIPENPAEPPETLTKLEDVADGKCSIDSFIKQLTDEEKAKLLCGTADPGTWGKGPFNGWADSGVSNTAGFGNCQRLGVPPVMTADGPAGLRLLKDLGIYATAWPVATMLACTWNTDLLYEYGVAVATEVKENNIGAWLGPGLNIHRNPLCGRNFEYFSEDPVVSGKMASAVIKGVQSLKIAATPKHFACNNKETNRKKSDSVISERALREIYLKGFEIAVKEASPWLIMTSYNKINGYNASVNYDLITGILREEWGYDGAVTTDWISYGIHGFEVKAGNDLKMPWGYPQEINDFVMSEVLPQSYIDNSVKRLLELILKIDC